MIEIQLNIDSAVEQVLAFKTCCGLKAEDQNLELLVRNHGDGAVTLLPVVEFLGEGEPLRIDNLMPGAPVTIAPGQVRAFYCTLEPERLQGMRWAVMREPGGREHRQALPHPAPLGDERP